MSKTKLTSEQKAYLKSIDSKKKRKKQKKQFKEQKRTDVFLKYVFGDILNPLSEIKILQGKVINNEHENEEKLKYPVKVTNEDFIKTIKLFINTYPNDQELGAEIRKLIHIDTEDLSIEKENVFMELLKFKGTVSELIIFLQKNFDNKMELNIKLSEIII